MKKSFYIVIVFISLTSCGQMNREIRYIDDAKSATEGAQWTNYDVSLYWDSINGLTKPYHFTVISRTDTDNPFFAVIEKDLLHFVMVKEKEVLVVDTRTRELSHFSDNKNDESVWFEQIRDETFSTLEYLSFYTISFSTQTKDLQRIPKIQQITDTTSQGIPYRKYVATHKKRLVWNEETNKYDIPLQYSSHIWLNQNTGQVDSIFVFRITENDFGRNMHYCITNVNHEDKSNYIDSVFNFDNPYYDEYTRHSETDPPLSRIGTRNDSIDESLIQFPFIDLQNDTIVLSNTEGWVLLDLWQFGCQPCYQGIKNLQQERDSLGYGMLEQEGIVIIAANAISDNLELINQVAEKCGGQDILYAGKGVFGLLALVNGAFPSYYLISPEKEIIWRSNYLGDYSELLEAKANYEKQH